MTIVFNLALTLWMINQIFNNICKDKEISIIKQRLKDLEERSKNISKLL